MYRLLIPFLAISNPFVKWVLRSRFHWLLSRKVVLLEVTGRKSGHTYYVPVNYSLISGGISVMAYRRRQWWRNVRSTTELPVYLEGKRIVTTPEVITGDIDAISAGLVDRGWVRKVVARAKPQDSVLIRLRFTRPATPGSDGPVQRA